MLSVGALTEASLLYRASRRLVDTLYRHANQIVVMSPAWGRAIEGYIGEPEKIHTIYNGVDLQRFRPGLDISDFQKKHHLPEKQMVTFIGTFAKQYDFESLLAVAERLGDRPDTQILLIGSGSQGEYVQQWLSEKNPPNLRWIEWLDHADIPAAWNASTVTFWAMRPHPLYQGTIPAKLYEALACGTPIIAATEGISTEMIRESRAGVTVPCGDVDGLVRTICYILDHPDQRAHYSQAARAYAEQHFDPQGVAAAYEAVLQLAAKS
jgi:glycosyltransferase involved in cell wall biosynthesis